MKTIAEMNRYVARNAGYYTASRSEAKVAVVWPDVTANFYSSEPAQMIDIDRAGQRIAAGNVDAEFNGVSEALLRAHVPFDVVDEVTLAGEPLDRYSLIFLPNVACMSEAAAKRLIRHVEDGGHIFATFETSLYDETGVRRPDFALGSLFGVAASGGIAGPNRWDFMKPVRKHKLLEGIEREMLPSSVYHVRVQPKGGETLLRFTVPMKGRYDGIPELSADPALVVRQAGKGTAVYFSGDFGNMVATFRLPEFLRLAANAARQLAPAAVTLEDSPGSVEVVWRAQPEQGRKLLHLVNFTGEMTRPIQRVVALRDLRITLAASEHMVKAHTLVRPVDLQLRRLEGGRTQVTLPRLEEYEVVVFEESRR
jgi:hypothetical protein